MTIPISKPDLTDSDIALVSEVLASGWVVQGPKVRGFEEAFCRFTASPHAVASTSCTASLHMALLALGVGPGDEVLVPAFTWVATANVVEIVGAKPRFVDIELGSFNVSATSLEAAIGPNTRAAIPVALFGLPLDISPILEVCRNRRLLVIEDDACALGAFRDGTHAGVRADIACFSFHPRKAITTGEGGMTITGDEKLAQALRELRDHGARTSDLARHLGPKPYALPEFPRVGLNYRMTDIQGALGLSQMGRLDNLLQRRRDLAAAYRSLLSADVPELIPQEHPTHVEHGYQSFVCLFAPEPASLESCERLHHERNRLMEHLQTNGISTRPGTHAVHMLDYYRHKYQIEHCDFPNSYLADQLSIALPLFSQMSLEEVEQVVACIRHFFRAGL